MDATGNVNREEARRSRAMMADDSRRHPLVRMLVREGITVTEFARTIGWPRTSVQAWYKKKGDPGWRACPPEAQRKMAKPPYNIPRDTWE